MNKKENEKKLELNIYIHTITSTTRTTRTIIKKYRTFYFSFS